MTSDRETTRVVREWVGEFETQLPDRVLDAVLDQLPITPQRRRWWPALAFAGPFVPVGVAAAAILIAAVLGLNLLGRVDVGGPDPSAPSPTPDVRSGLLFWSGRDLPAGEYVVDEPFPLRLRFTVPDGWHAFGVVDGLAAICSNACELPDRVGLGFWVVSNVYADACDPAGEVNPPIGPGVEDLAAALTSLPRHSATTPRSVSIGGQPATYLELTAAAELGPCALPGFRAWTTGADVRDSPPGERNRLWILEIDGVRLMVDMAIPATAGAEDVAELEAVVESLRFDPDGG
jgi:hypothetical protein